MLIPQHFQAALRSKGLDVSSSSLRRWGNSMRDQICATIEHVLTSQDGFYFVRCDALWQISSYCRNQLDGSNELHTVLTLTGTKTSSQATSCEEYVRHTWGAQGLSLLETLVCALRESQSSKS